MTDDVVDPGRRYPCLEGTVQTRVFLKRGTPWPLRSGTQVLYKKSESASAHWMGATVTEMRGDGTFVLQVA